MKSLALVALIGCLIGLAGYYVAARYVLTRRLLPNGQLLRFLSVLSIPIWVGIGIIVAIMLWAKPAVGHESWISNGSFKNNAGEWCCGTNDCKELGYTPRPVYGGVLLNNGEMVPQAEIMPVSPDGWVVCRRNDGTRRCTFAPPEGS